MKTRYVGRYGFRGPKKYGGKAGFITQLVSAAFQWQ